MFIALQSYGCPCPNVIRGTLGHPYLAMLVAALFPGILLYEATESCVTSCMRRMHDKQFSSAKYATYFSPNKARICKVSLLGVFLELVSWEKAPVFDADNNLLSIVVVVVDVDINHIHNENVALVTFGFVSVCSTREPPHIYPCPCHCCISYRKENAPAQLLKERSCFSSMFLCEIVHGCNAHSSQLSRGYQSVLCKNCGTVRLRKFTENSDLGTGIVLPVN